jgi:hypothetical protein
MARMASCAARPVSARDEKLGFSRFPRIFCRHQFPIRNLKPFARSA